MLALPHLITSEDRGVVWAWKTFDWDAMDRLHEKGPIPDPKREAKSVVLTERGRRAAEETLRKLFAS